MDCIEYESCYLKEAEWNVLLAGIGLKQWYGLGDAQNPSGNAQDKMHRILAELYQKNVIDWKDEAAVIKEPFSGLLASLPKSEHCIVIGQRKEDVPLRCCYIGTRQVVVTEKSRREADALCVFALPKEAFLSFVLENIEVSEGIFAQDEEDAFTESETIFSLERRNCRSGQLEGELILQEQGLQTFLLIKKAAVTQIPYRRQQLEQCLREWLYKEDKR